MNLTVTPYRYNNTNIAFARKTKQQNPQREVSPNYPTGYITTPDAFKKETFNVDIALGQLKNINESKTGATKDKFSLKKSCWNEKYFDSKPWKMGISSRFS